MTLGHYNPRMTLASSPTTAIPALDVRGLRKCFPGVEALKGIDLCVEQGEFFGLLGPNGAGKSTLINIIAGLSRADSGDVFIMGHHVSRDFRRARASVGIVPQELVFDPFFSVRESLRIQAGYYGVGRQGQAWIEEVLAALMLTDKANANMRTLSGGMKRRVLIAQALVHRPAVIVLDEPTAGVDVELRRCLWEFIKRLHREGHTIILTTHYLEEAESLCQRIGIINHGQLIALDSTERLIASGIGGKARLRIHTTEPAQHLPPSLQTVLLASDGRELLFEFDKSTLTVPDLIDQLRAANITIVDIHTEQADLEDVFIELTGKKPA